MRNRIFAALAVTMLGVLASATPANATTPDCRTVVSHLTDRPDSGNHGTWANDTATRTVLVCHIPAVVLAEAKSVIVEGWTYGAKLTDEGTFVTAGGAHLSPNNGHALLADVPGTFTGGFTTTFQAPADWQFWNGAALDGHTFTGTPGGANPTTSNWVKALWTSGFEGDSIGKDWSWTYKTCNEQWVDANANESGTTAAAGDITGTPFTFIHRTKIWTPCYAVSFDDQCDGTHTTLGNPSSNPLSVALYKIGDVAFEVTAGHTSTTNSGKADTTVKATFTQLTWSHTWVEPKGCATPSPSPSPSPSPVVVVGGGDVLPVTGQSLQGEITVATVAGIGVLLLGVGWVVVKTVKRRRKAA
jgi:hypothetical protein